MLPLWEWTVIHDRCECCVLKWHRKIGGKEKGRDNFKGQIILWFLSLPLDHWADGSAVLAGTAKCIIACLTKETEIHVVLCWGYPDIPVCVGFRSRCTKRLIALALPLLVGGGESRGWCYLWLNRWYNRQWWSQKCEIMAVFFQSIQTIRVSFHFCNLLIDIGKSQNCWILASSLGCSFSILMVFSLWDLTGSICPFFRVSVTQ